MRLFPPKLAFPARFRRFHVQRALPLSDDEISAIYAAAAPIPVEDRGPFLEAIAAALSAESAIGPGALHRLIRELQPRFLQPESHRGPFSKYAG
jgi:hypothetical protein